MKMLSSGLLLLCGWISVSAASLEITAEADTTIFVGTVSPGSPSGTEFVAGATPRDGFARSLIRFNVASVPTNAVIDAASVSVTVTKKALVATAPHSFGLHRASRAWDEAQATWTAAAAGSDWTTAGGDYEVDASASTPLDLGTGTFSSETLATDVQAWVSGDASNVGWILRTSNESINQSARRIASHEAFDPNTRPKLSITYHVLEPAEEITMVNARNVAGLLGFDFQASAGKAYAVEFIDQIGAQWRTLTNVSVQASTLANVQDVTTNSQRIYRVSTPSPIP
ncbi:MAG TPA: DNRLRE domain-containing protein [Candidatus Acidoferrum sp.]|nr:DNRLRE domain-containing protein [Candidatus Acidoferrum sp.]